MTLSYFLLKGHSIKEFENMSMSEFLFMQSVMEFDLELKEEIAKSLNKK